MAQGDWFPVPPAGGFSAASYAAAAQEPAAMWYAHIQFLERLLALVLDPCRFGRDMVGPGGDVVATAARLDAMLRSERIAYAGPSPAQLLALAGGQCGPCEGAVESNT
jgi:hypothetical protein